MDQMMERAYSDQGRTSLPYAEVTGSHRMDRCRTDYPSFPFYGPSSEAPYTPKFHEPIIWSNPLQADGLDDFAPQAFSSSFSFDRNPPAAFSWNGPSTPELAADESSHSSSSMSRSPSSISSYPPTNIPAVASTPWQFSDASDSFWNKTQFDSIGAVFDTPISPHGSMFPPGYLPAAVSTDDGSMIFLPAHAMDRSMSSTTSSSDPLVSIAAASQVEEEFPHRRTEPSFFYGSAGRGVGGRDDERAPSNKMKISRNPRAPARHVENKNQRLVCEHCDQHPEGFRGEHELMRHKRLFHAPTTRKWVCADLHIEDGIKTDADWYRPKLSLEECQNCRNGKQYGQYYNAAAHLRRYHFYPKPRGRPKGDARPRRAGSAGGNEPSIAMLKKYWLRSVEVRNPNRHYAAADEGDELEHEREWDDAIDDDDNNAVEDEEEQHEREQQHQDAWNHGRQRQPGGRDPLLGWPLGEGVPPPESGMIRPLGINGASSRSHLGLL